MRNGATNPKMTSRSTGKRLKNPLDAAIRDILLPVISPHGFSLYSPHIIGRLVNREIFQFIQFHRHSFWYANYNAIPLFQDPDRSELYLGPPGERFETWIGDLDKKSGKLVITHEATDVSMRSIVSELETYVLDWFNTASTTSGLIRLFESDSNGINSEIIDFYIAICQLRLGNIDVARKLLDRSHFINPYWPARYRELAQSIGSRTHAKLLANWQSAYLKQLKLG